MFTGGAKRHSSWDSDDNQIDSSTSNIYGATETTAEELASTLAQGWKKLAKFQGKVALSFIGGANLITGQLFPALAKGAVKKILIKSSKGQAKEVTQRAIVGLSEVVSGDERWANPENLPAGKLKGAELVTGSFFSPPLGNEMKTALSTADLDGRTPDSADYGIDEVGIGLSGPMLYLAKRSGDTTTTTPTEAQSGGGFVDNFDYPGDELPAHGWTEVSGQFTTRDSYLTTEGSEANQRIAREQPLAAGTFAFTNLQNEARYYGLSVLFIGDGKQWGKATGYSLVTPQSRSEGKAYWNDIRLVRKDEDGAENLLTLTQHHDEKRHDVRIERDPATYEFTCYLNGQKVGSVKDDTYTESSHMVLKYDKGGNEHRIDRIEVDS